MNQNQSVRSGAAATMYGDLLPDWVRERPKDFYAGTAEWLNITAGQSVVQTVAIPNDADYLIVGMNGSIWNQGAITKPTTNSVKVVLEDSGSGRRMMNAAAMWDDIIGTGQLPGYWPYPKLIPRASIISITLSPITGSAAMDIRTAFLGFKIFDAS